MTASPALPRLPRIVGDRSFLAVYALAYAGGVIAYLPVLTFLLPMKVEALAGDARLDVFTACVVAGALAASLSNILFGMLSDRSRAAGGGRRRWMALGLAATLVSYAVLVEARTSGAVVIAVAGFQFAVNALLAPLIAIMAEEVPDQRKGLAGGLLALGAPLASGVSAVLLASAGGGDAARFGIVFACVAVATLPLLCARAMPAASGAQAPPALAPLLRRDLVVAWTARLLVQVAGNVLSLYLLYYFESIVRGEPPLAVAARLGQLLTIAYMVPLPIAILCGRISDRIGRRKPFLLAAALAAAAGLAGMALAGDWRQAAAAFALYAAGSAVFLALHAAFAMQLLPDPRHRGRDLGLLNLTNTLPALGGPMLAWSLSTPRDFGATLLVLAALTAAGGVLMLAVRGRR